MTGRKKTFSMELQEPAQSAPFDDSNRQLFKPRVGISIRQRSVGESRTCDRMSHVPACHAMGCCFWLTGLPCSGKSTIAGALQGALEGSGRTVTLLDGDKIRPLLCPDLGYSDEDRLQNMLRLAFVALEVVRHGGIVIVAAVSPFEKHRSQVRSQFDPTSFVQVWVNAPLSECERRDVKGMYKQARQGKIAQFTGLSSAYEPPLQADVVCDTQTSSVEECVNSILRHSQTGSPLG